MHQIYANNTCVFTVWAPEKEAMILHILTRQGSGEGRMIDMRKDHEGYFRTEVGGVEAGDRYYYRPGKDLTERTERKEPEKVEPEKEYPDPASFYQPGGVHGPSEIVDHDRYAWGDGAWRGLPFKELILYEVHVGAFTPGGRFEDIIPLLDDLVATGINAIELMPVAQCPGSRNWGYDGVFLYAVQNTYGGPEALKKLVDACHQKGIAVFLDVVYNHVGGEGNCLDCFGPYFSDKYRTPWGKALNFDGAWSDGVKEYVTGNVVYWAEKYHIDGLRLDAIHEIFDRNAVTIWDLLQERVREWEQRSGRSFWLVAESDLNSPRVVRPPELGGYGFDAQWLDDFHHALYVLLDEEGIRHYQDFGQLEQLAKAYTQGFVHSGEYVWFRKRRHGASSAGIPGERFIIFNQNHDLPGNRPGGERLSVLVDFERLKLAAAAVLLAPYVPMLFMGEEYGEEAPFYFFSDYSDPAIRKGLREGRKKEFAAFQWNEEPPDPQEESVFLRSKLQWHRRGEGRHALLLAWHRRLIRLRKEHPLLRDLSRTTIRADLLGGLGQQESAGRTEGRKQGAGGLALHRHSADGCGQLVCLFNFSGEELNYVFPYSLPAVAGQEKLRWRKLICSADKETAEIVEGTDTLPLAPRSVSVYELMRSY